MKKFKIPKEPNDISKTLRIKAEYVKKVQEIANHEKISLNKVVNNMIKFSLENSDYKFKDDNIQE